MHNIVKFVCQLAFCTFLLLPAESFGQKLADVRKEADAFFENGRFREAMFSYSQYQQEKPGNVDVLLNLGICHFKIGNGKKALEYLEYVFSQDSRNANPKIFYYMARAHHGLHNFQDAVLYYKAYLKATSEKNTKRGYVRENIKRCLSGMNSLANPEVALVENLGSGVNTEFDEFAPLESVNHSGRIYFSASKPNSVGGRRDANGLAADKDGHFCSDMYYVDSDHSGWFYPQTLNELLNTSRHEVALGFNENGKVLYYFRGFSQYSGDLLTDTSGRNDERSFRPKPFKNPIFMEKGDAAPFFFKDSILIFASRRAGGFGGLDLYYSIRQPDSIWSEAENFGPEINSAYDETFPFMTKDGRTLYFSSNRVESMGGLDVFSSSFVDLKREWLPVKSLGLPINSAGDESYFRLDESTEKAYFSSDRLGGNGLRDLYVAYFKEPRKSENEIQKPLFFATVKNTPMLLLGATAGEEQIELTFDAIHYDNDEDLLSSKYQKNYTEIAELAQSYPNSKVVITVHTDESGPSKFDLYYGIKRAELIGDALLRAGLSSQQIILRSGGANFPQAREVLEMEENPVGKALNRRAELELKSLVKLPVRTNMKEEPISENMESQQAALFKQRTKDLYFKTVVTTTRQLLNSDILAMFDDIMIESTAGSGDYRYTVGLFESVEQATQAEQDLKSQGFPEAYTVAYINDIPLSRFEAKEWLKKYPALTPYAKIKK